MYERNQSRITLENVTKKVLSLSSSPSRCWISTQINGQQLNSCYQNPFFQNLLCKTLTKSKKFAENLSLMKSTKTQNWHYKSIEESYTRILKEGILNSMMLAELKALLQCITRNINHWWRKARKKKNLPIIIILF